MSNQQEDHIRGFFPTPIFFTHYSKFAEEREKLLATVYEIRREDEAGEQRSDQNYNVGYTSFFSQRNLQEHPSFVNLIAFIKQKATNFAKYLKFDLEHFELAMTSLWININPKHSFHGDHIHPKAHLSGVFYLQCPKDSGDIIFKSPKEVSFMFPASYAEITGENAIDFRCPPKEGGLLLFPSWLTHSVGQNISDEERVSMSFNLFQMTRPSVPT